MANKKFIVEYLIKARDAFSQNANKVTASNKKLNESVKKITRTTRKQTSVLRNIKAVILRAKRKLRDYRKETLRTEKASSKLIKTLKGFAVIAVVTLGIRAIISEGSKLQDAMADLSAITGSSGNDLVKLKGRIKELSVEFKTMPTEVAAAFKAVASAKPELLKNAELLAEVTKQSLLLKEAAGIDTAQAVDTLTRGLNIFSAGAKDAAKFVDILAAGSKFGSSEIGNTGEAMLIAGGAAVDAGLSFKQLNSAIQVVAKGGFVASQAGTGLQAIFIRLTKAGFDFKKLGVDGVMFQVAKMLDKVKGSAAKAQLKSKLFGEEHQKIAGALLRNIPLITELDSKLEQTGVAAEQAAIRSATLSKSAELMKVKMSLLASGIFDKTTPALAFMTDSVNTLLSSFDKSDIEAFSLILTGVAAVAVTAGAVIAGAFKVVFGAVKVVLAVLKGIGEIIGQVAAAILSLDFSAFDLFESFSLGGSFLGIFGGDDEIEKAKAVVEAQENAAKALQKTSLPALKLVENQKKQQTTKALDAQRKLQAQPSQPLLKSVVKTDINSRVDVGVNVSLDEGLKQTSTPSINSTNIRRTDVGSTVAAI